MLFGGRPFGSMSFGGRSFGGYGNVGWRYVSSVTFNDIVWIMTNVHVKQLTIMVVVTQIIIAFALTNVIHVSRFSLNNARPIDECCLVLNQTPFVVPRFYLMKGESGNL